MAERKGHLSRPTLRT